MCIRDRCTALSQMLDEWTSAADASGYQVEKWMDSLLPKEAKKETTGKGPIPKENSPKEITDKKSTDKK